jgi:hypothetical protein
MHGTRRRAIAALMALAVLLLTIESAAPVGAVTLQRTWSARMGTNGSAGGITMRAYTNKTGSIRYSLHGLRKDVSYSVQVRYGTCSSLGSLAVQLPAIHSSATGTVSLARSLTQGQIYWIWRAARRTSFVIRIVSGTSIRCGAFTFTHATRVAVAGLGIDLPVVRGPSGYPPCRVALYHAQVAQPREPGITFIYAHARTGMFLPLLTRWRIDRGKSLIGKTVKVWTSDSYVSSYRIYLVRVTTDAMAGVTSLSNERLWLQTSTGPNTTYPKLIVQAVRYQTVKTTYSASHPTAHPISC